MSTSNDIINSLGWTALEGLAIVITNQIRFDALQDGYCKHHGGKCSDLLDLLNRVQLRIKQQKGK